MSTSSEAGAGLMAASARGIGGALGTEAAPEATATQDFHSAHSPSSDIQWCPTESLSSEQRASFVSLPMAIVIE